MSKVLVVDNSSSLLIVYKEYLTRRSIEVITAETAAEALRILERDKDISHLITDIVLPCIDGLTMIKAIRIEPEHYFSPKIFVHTGSLNHNQYLDSLLQEGKIQGYTFKPHSLTILYDFVCD